MPAGSFFSGEQGILELIDPSDDSVIGEVPCLKSWTLEAAAELSQLGSRCMASNGDGSIPGTGTGHLKATFPFPVDGDGLTVGTETYTWRDAPSLATDIQTIPQGDWLSDPTPAYASIAAVLVAESALVTAVAEPDGQGTDGVKLTALVTGSAGDVLVWGGDVYITDLAGATTHPGLTGGDVPIPVANWQAQVTVSRNWNVSAEFAWQEAANIPAAVKMDPTKSGESVKLKLFPNGRSAGKVQYAGTARIETVSIPAEVSGEIRTTVQLRGAGALVKNTL